MLQIVGSQSSHVTYIYYTFVLILYENDVISDVLLSFLSCNHSVSDSQGRLHQPNLIPYLVKCHLYLSED